MIRILNYKVIVVLVLRLILEGMTAGEAVAKISEDFQVSQNKLWGILPDIYK
jgi:hypothetical protein